MSTIRLQPDGSGYLLDGEPVDGFPDNEALNDKQRARIALWGQRFAPDSLSDVQKRLLRDRPRPRVSERQRELRANRADLEELSSSGLWDALEEREKSWVARPGSHPDLPNDAGYPLTTGDLEKLTGASGRQLRYWIDCGLVPAIRSSRQRRVYSAGAAQALVLANRTREEKTVLGSVLNGEAGTFLRLQATALRAWALDLPTQAQAQVTGIAAGLVALAEQMSTGENATVLGGSAPAVTRLHGVEEAVDVVPALGLKRGTAFFEAVLEALGPLTISGLSVEPEIGAEEIEALRADLDTYIFGGKREGKKKATAAERFQTEVGEIVSNRIHTIPVGDAWANFEEGGMRFVGSAKTKAEAEAEARKRAKAEEGAHLIYKRDGGRDIKVYGEPVRIHNLQAFGGPVEAATPKFSAAKAARRQRPKPSSVAKKKKSDG